MGATRIICSIDLRPPPMWTVVLAAEHVLRMWGPIVGVLRGPVVPGAPAERGLQSEPEAPARV